MMRIKKAYAYVFLFAFIISVIVGLLTLSLNLFFSCLLIGFWIAFTMKFFEKIRKYRQFNSPHNTSFFIIVPLFIGLIYSYWGYFDTIPLLSDNFFLNSRLYLSAWTLLFAFPYLMYGSKSLYNCYRKYNIVYIYRSRGIGSRKFAFFYTFFIILIIIVFWSSFYAVSVSPFYLERAHSFIDFNLLLMLLISIYLIIVPGIVKRRRPVSRLSPEELAQRRSRIQDMNAAAASRSQRPPASRPTPMVSSASRSAHRPSRPQQKPQTASSSSHSASTKVKQAQPKPSKPPSAVRPGKPINFEKLKPKAGILSLEDFKCIFCFQLPSDDKRGVILCPVCRHPAHADEFTNWLDHSNLCSRCGAEIPFRFRERPEIIPARDYVEVIKHYSKR